MRPPLIRRRGGAERGIRASGHRVEPGSAAGGAEHGCRVKGADHERLVWLVEDCDTDLPDMISARGDMSWSSSIERSPQNVGSASAGTGGENSSLASPHAVPRSTDSDGGVGLVWARKRAWKRAWTATPAEVSIVPGYFPPPPITRRWPAL